MATDNKENVTLDDLNGFTVPHLKNFLKSYNQKVTGKAAELRQRAKGVLELNLECQNTLNLRDQREFEVRHSSKFVTPLGESLPIPESLTIGWNTDLSKVPKLTEKELYNYLVLNSGRTYDGDICGAKKQLKARVFYEDNHVYEVDIIKI